MGIVPILALIPLSLAGCGPPQENQPAARFSNPIITGFAPDPSIARVGDDFYLVTSTFEYFPGVPVYHSRDLVNWELISYALHDTAQVDLDTVSSGSGIHASTIRFHDGTFYVVTTNNIAGELVSFIVTAEDPRGPWSAPFVLEGAPGIDPSLFFDDDGRVWYVANRQPADPEFPGQMEIWLQELDLRQMALRGERHYLWRGCCGGAWAEGPHIYRRDGYYYLLISEGGTAYEHALSVAISTDITGPYENNPRNPILSHRQLSYDHPITGVGHADLVELADGRWYAVALGWRLIDGLHGILGRETFLVPVTWETEPYWWKEDKLSFPVVSPLSGKVDLHYPMPFPGTVQNPASGFEDSFDDEDLMLEWNLRRTPPRPFHSLVDNSGSLRLYLQPGRIAEHAQYSFVGVRQRHFQFEATTQMTFAPTTAAEEAGLTVIQNDRSAFLMTLSGDATGNEIRLYQSMHGEITTIAEQRYAGEAIYFKVAGDYLDYDFYYSADGENWLALMEKVDGVSLSPAVIEGYNYTGVYIGLYASSNGAPTDNYADFGFFRYQPVADARDHWYYRQRDREMSE
jgi:alpha-N-arabinofuranosidase